MKRKIRYHGQEYDRWEDLPAAAQETCRKSCQSGTVTLNHVLDKIVVGSPRFALHGHARAVYDDIMSVVENNGRVTLPDSADPFLSRHGMKVILAVGSLLAVAGLAVVARAIG